MAIQDRRYSAAATLLLLLLRQSLAQESVFDRLVRAIASTSTFARSEDPGVQESFTGYLLDRPDAEVNRPDRMLVTNSSAVEIMSNTVVVLRSLLNDITGGILRPSNKIGSHTAADWDIPSPETVSKPTDQQPEGCRVVGLSLSSDSAMHLAAPTIDLCAGLCAKEQACVYYTYDSQTRSCTLMPRVDLMEPDMPEWVISGTKECARRRRLSEDCFVSDMSIEGSPSTTVQSIPSAGACQSLCRSQSNCQYFAWGPSNVCNLFVSATGITVADGVTSGPRSCGSTADDNALVGAEAAPEGGGDILYDGDAPSNAADDATETGGILGGVLNVLSPKDGSAAEGLSGMSSGVGGAVQAGMGAISGIQTVLAAADTVMNTIPINELVNTGMSLANSGILSGSGVTNRHPDTTAPEGIDNPTVTCLSEGIRCCIPRLAAPNYKKNPPTLNGITASQCQTTYVSTTDQLCATTMYDDNICGIEVQETSKLTVYRHVVQIPNAKMNNAICECAISKTPNDDGTKTVTASGKWEYSLAAASEQAERSAKNNEAVDKLSKAARMGVTWMDALGGSGASSGGSATGFITNILDLTDTLRSNNPKRSLQAAKRPSPVSIPNTCSLWPLECAWSPEKGLLSANCKGTYILKEGCPQTPASNWHIEELGDSVIHTFNIDFTLINSSATRGWTMACDFTTPLLLEGSTVDLPNCANTPPDSPERVLDLPILQAFLAESGVTSTISDKNTITYETPMSASIVLPSSTNLVPPSERKSMLFNLEANNGTLLAIPF